MSDVSNLCLCCSGLVYDECCKPFHEGEICQNALQLMRSRYCAYALDLPDYIVRTTHPKNKEYSKDAIAWIHAISTFSQKSTFCGLEILDFKNGLLKAIVTFRACIRQGESDVSFTEKSTFLKDHNQWLYFYGEMH